MIFDIHSHLLPGIDDGSPNMEVSMQLVRDQIEDGVTEMILTPHYRLDWYHERKERIRTVYEEFLDALDREGLQIRTYLAQEAHDDPRMLQEFARGNVLTLPGTNCFLLELDWKTHNEQILDTVQAYLGLGFKPIIVHYERFLYKTISEVRSLRDAGALFQINTYSLFGVESAENRDFALEMLDEGLVDFVATDYHFQKFRKTKEAYQLIGERYGAKARDYLFYDNAKLMFGSR